MRDESWRRYDAARQRLVLDLHVQPNARKSAVAGPHGNALKVKVAAPAVDNKANAELIDYLSESLGVPRSSVLIRHGATGRRKVVEVLGGPELVPRLDLLLGRTLRRTA